MFPVHRENKGTWRKPESLLSHRRDVIPVTWSEIKDGIENTECGTYVEKSMHMLYKAIIIVIGV